MNPNSESDDDLHTFDLSMAAKKPPPNFFSALSSIPTSVKENPSTIKTVAETVEVIKEFNPHLKQFEFKMPKVKIPFKCDFAESGSHFLRTKSDAYDIVEHYRNFLMENGVPVELLSTKNCEQIIVVRVIKCEDTDALVEDKSCKEVIKVTTGVMWLGMIAAVKVVWEMGKYHVKEIVSIHPTTYKPTPNFRGIDAGNKQTKITVASGPYMDPEEIEWIGLHMVKKIAQENFSNTIILMGPFIDYAHPKVASLSVRKSFLKLMAEVQDYFATKLPDVQIYLVPSTHDIIHIHPFPQPKFGLRPYEDFTYIGNPSYLTHNQLSVEIINHDFVEEIRNNLVGKVYTELLEKIYDAYLRQPMLMSCTGDAPVAENKLKSMYLGQNGHGKIVIYSSTTKQATIVQRGDTLFINVGTVMGNSSKVGNIVNMTYFDNNALQVCESVFVEINRLKY